MPIEVESVSDHFDVAWDSDSSLEVISEDGIESEVRDSVVGALSILNNEIEMDDGDRSVATEPEAVDELQEVVPCASEGDADFLGLTLDSWLQMWREGKCIERYVFLFLLITTFFVKNVKNV